MVLKPRLLCRIPLLDNVSQWNSIWFGEERIAIVNQDSQAIYIDLAKGTSKIYQLGLEDEYGRLSIKKYLENHPEFEAKGRPWIRLECPPSCSGVPRCLPRKQDPAECEAMAWDQARECSSKEDLPTIWQITINEIPVSTMVSHQSPTVFADSPEGPHYIFIVGSEIETEVYVVHPTIFKKKRPITYRRIQGYKRT